MRAPSVSVLIPQWGQTAFTARAVDAFRRSDYAGDVEILVHDNASPGGPGSVAERPDVVLSRSDRNLGFGPAIDAMAERARGDLLVLGNNDVVPAPDCLTWLVRRYEATDQPGAVAPRYRTFDGLPLESGSYLGRDGRGWQLFHGVDAPLALRRLPYLAHYGSAAALLVGRRQFLDGGGFDDAYAPAYYEDTDLCVRWWQDGRPTVVEPRAVVFHFEGGTSGRDVAAGPKALQLTHQATFVQRWRPWLRRLPPISFRVAVEHALTSGSTRPPILWMAPHLPRADREGGHARMLRMLTTLKEAGHAVALWAENGHDADRYGRVLEAAGIPWFAHARRTRWERPARSEPALLNLGDVLDAVRWAAVVLSFPEFAERMIPEVRAHAPWAAVLVDDVDLHHVRHEREGATAPNAMEKTRELAIYARADGLITASDAETAIVREEVPGLAVRTFAVAAEEPRPSTGTPRASVLFLGNFGHPPNVDAVAWWVGELADRVARDVGRRVPLRVIGSGTDAYADAWSAAGDRLDVVGWVPDLDDELARARVFVAPLRFGAGTKGKLATALAHGVPVVTTTVGAEGFSDEVLDALVVADDAHELAAAIARLVTDDPAWEGAVERTRRAASVAVRRQQVAVEELVAWVARRIDEKGRRPWR